MVNDSRYYTALESVSIALALSTALTIYPCQIRVHQRWQSKLNFLQLGRRSGGRPQRTVYPRRLPINCDTHYIAGIEPTTFRLLVRRATNSLGYRDQENWKLSQSQNYVNYHFKASSRTRRGRGSKKTVSRQWL